MDKDEKQKYFNSKSNQMIRIRFTPEERTLLEDKMREEDWENMSSFIKYKIFGSNAEEKIEKRIKTKDPQTILSYLVNLLKKLNGYLEYFKYRYEKDMQQLYREEGADEKKWINATRKWNLKALHEAQKVAAIITQIAETMGLKVRFDQTYDESEDQYADTSANTREAEKLWKEIIQKDGIDVFR